MPLTPFHMPPRLRAAFIVILTLFASSRAHAQRPTPLPLDLLMLQTEPVGHRLPARWKTREVRFHRAPDTEIVDSGAIRYLRVSGTDRAAWFYRQLDRPIEASSGRLGWSWRVPLAPAGANSNSPGTDDAALRVFVVFARHGRFAVTPRALFYTVADGEPSHRDGQADAVTALIVGRPANTIHWTGVEADPFRDYQRLWGGAVPRIVAIGVMQDTDQTMTPAVGELLRLHWRFVDDGSR